jgi:hypothetical protein
MDQINGPLALTMDLLRQQYPQGLASWQNLLNSFPDLSKLRRQFISDIVSYFGGFELPDRVVLLT